MTITDLESILKSRPRVLVKFSAKWCGPCKAMEPGLQQLETEPGFPMVVRVDVEENVELSAKFGIRAMPTLMLFENGGPVLTQVGALSQTQLRSFVTTQSIAKL